MYLVSLQIITNFIKLIITFSYNPYIKYPQRLMSKFAGVCWPQYWNSPVAIDTVTPFFKSPKPMIQPYQILSFTMNNLILLLSFGLCSPVLCWSITLNVCLNLSSWLMLIGRFITHRLQYLSSNESVNDNIFNILSQQFVGVQSSLIVCKRYHLLDLE